MWFIIGMEMLTFGLLFIVFSIARARDLPLFQAGQATLDLDTGALNTAWLLTGSWCVARGVRALRADRHAAGARWLWSGVACGLAFLALKSVEYAGKAALGIGLETDTFWMFYILLTGFHFLHVAAAVLLLAGTGWLAGRGRWGAHDSHAPETVAAFWHMVDLLWIVLFPLVYVMR